MRSHAPYRIRFPQVAVVFQPGVQALVILAHHQRQVEHGHRDLHIDRLYGQVGQLDGPWRRVRMRSARTNITWNSGVWLVSRSAWSASTSISKGTSWCMYAPRAVSRTCCRQVRGSSLAVSFVAHDQGVDEKADQPLDLGMVAVGDRVCPH